MKAFQTSISIRSTPEKIWKILTDAPNFAAWNTTVNKVEGTIALGQKIKVFAKISPNRAFAVKVAVLESNQKMVWADGMPLGLFKAERTFTLTPKGDGTVDFSMREVFRGLMSPLIEKSIPDLQPSFEEFAACLKRQAEA